MTQRPDRRSLDAHWGHEPLARSGTLASAADDSGERQFAATKAGVTESRPSANAAAHLTWRWLYFSPAVNSVHGWEGRLSRMPFIQSNWG